MKVLMVSDVFFPRVNGVSTSIETFRKKIKQYALEISLLVPSYENREALYNPEDRIYRVPSRPVPRDPEDRLMSWSAAWKYWPNIQTNRYELVHIQTPFIAHYLGLRLTRRLGVPAIATYHTLFEEYLHHYLPILPASGLRLLARTVSRWQCNSLNHIIVPSSAMSDRLISYGVTRPITVLPTGIPLERFRSGSREHFRNEYKISPKRPVLLYVGRVAFEKNIGFLISMVEQLQATCPDVLLIIAGEGPAEKVLKAEVTRKGLQNNVLFLGYLDRENALPDVYAGADLFVFSSKTETQGLVLLEAMASGLPVVALSIMGTKDILDPMRGSKIAEDCPHQFAQTVRTILSDPTLKSSMSQAAISFASEWSDEIQAKRLASLYHQVVNT